MRFLVLIVLVVLAVWLIRRAIARAGSKEGRPAQGGTGGGDLVKCAHCGVHLPRAEARQSADALYCSDEHARLGPGGS